METRPSSESTEATFLDGPITAEYRPVMELSNAALFQDSCVCSDSCEFEVVIRRKAPAKRKPRRKPKAKPRPKRKPTPKKKASDLSEWSAGWSAPPPTATPSQPWV